MDFNHHYDKLAEKYDELKVANWDEQMEPTILELIRKMLDIKPEDVLLDVGAGTGSCLAYLRQQVSPKLEWVNMDPSPKMCEVARKRPGLIVLEGRADNTVEVLEQAGLQHRPNKVIAKRCAHHFIPVFAKFAADMFKYLPSGGQLLVIVTDRKCSLPFFKEAADRFTVSNADPSHYINSFNEAGFTTTIDKPDYVTKVPKDFWYEFIRNRGFSTLRNFSDEELEEGIKETEARFPDQQELPLTEHFVYILATKP